MKSVAIYEVKNRFAEMIIAAERGEEVTITRHGAPVARLTAFAAAAAAPIEQRTRVESAMRQLRQLGAGCELGCSVKEAIAEGRD
ncbi:MAG: type II toxin-antitoxin system Phd/YefM family antitoxin [Rhodoferax sp.]